ncbi:MAG TPA: endonuclease/exonuclease/phosphatase family protein [Gaiellaceae bacterium]|nr:endonuclease/exonuclease/phosphatase family protein [Gaiellaceae bacterium]
MVVRTWNVFHGNASPPERHAFLAEMVRLVTRDTPAVVCLQELPVWSLSLLDGWSGMTSIGAVAARPVLGSWAAALDAERRLTDLDSGLFRSALTGQANAVLFGDSLRVLERRTIRLNPLTFRRQEARRLALSRAKIVRWGKNRRVCQAIRARRNGQNLVVANVHATGDHDKRIVDAELLRAASFVDGFAEPDEPIVLAGDFNLTVGNSRMLPDLMSRDWGFEGATPSGIDHVLVRGLTAEAPHRWPTERRTLAGRVLSDHAPVERELS